MPDAPGFTDGFVVERAEVSETDEIWEPAWGEVRRIRYRELAMTLRQPSTNYRRLVLRFRLFDDGLGFRYELPEQPALDKASFRLTSHEDGAGRFAIRLVADERTTPRITSR